MIDEKTFRIVVDVLQALSSVAVPFVLVWAAHVLQRKQKFAEAVTAEKVKHYEAISPHLNVIFSFRFRVGDFLDRSPESVLEAKRKADLEFWTFEYLWSDEFRAAYHAFMEDGFKIWGKEGSKALIRAEAQFYRVPPNTHGWEGFSGDPVDREHLGKLYNALKTAIARDLGFRK